MIAKTSKAVVSTKTILVVDTQVWIPVCLKSFKINSEC